MCTEAGSAMTARDLWVRYGTGPWIVQGLDLTIEQGERLAVVGANGAGKSTLLHALAGLVAVGRGVISPARTPGSVGLVLQDPDDQLFGATVVEDVALGLVDRRIDPHEIAGRVERVLAALGLSALAGTAVHQLSLGQRKRVALAGILVTEPRVVLLDEPTAGLDPYAVDELLSLLDELRRAGTAIVITTHDTMLADEWADRVFVMDRGQVLAHGRPAQVLNDDAVMARARLRPASRPPARQRPAV